MSKTLDAIRRRPHVLAVDDERSQGNSIIITLKQPFCYVGEKDCGVQGFDNVTDAKRGTAASNVYERAPDVGQPTNA